MNELIILGNGFDLHCNLKSSFNDFFVAKELDNAKQWIDNYTSEAFKKTNLISLFWATPRGLRDLSSPIGN